MKTELRLISKIKPHEKDPRCNNGTEDAVRRSIDEVQLQSCGRTNAPIGAEALREAIGCG